MSKYKIYKVFYLYNTRLFMMIYYDSAPLFCSGETSLAVLHPDVESSLGDRYESVGVCLQEDHRNDPRVQTSPPQG